MSTAEDIQCWHRGLLCPEGISWGGSDHAMCETCYHTWSACWCPAMPAYALDGYGAQDRYELVIPLILGHECPSLRVRDIHPEGGGHIPPRRS
jgi:hypothetical protein